MKCVLCFAARDRFAQGDPTRQIGRSARTAGCYLGILLSVTFLVVFGVQGAKAHAHPEKRSRTPLFALMCVGSFIAVVVLVLNRPVSAGKTPVASPTKVSEGDKSKAATLKGTKNAKKTN